MVLPNELNLFVFLLNFYLANCHFYFIAEVKENEMKKVQSNLLNAINFVKSANEDSFSSLCYNSFGQPKGPLTQTKHHIIQKSKLKSFIIQILEINFSFKQLE